MILSCSNLSVVYGRRQALSSFSLFLKNGEIHTLIGPNGSGKSTALQALAGLIQPTEGEVTIHDKSINRMPRRQLARHLAFLPQQPSAPDEMTVERLVRQGRFAHVGLFRNYREEDEAAIHWALESTGLIDFAERNLRELSGGERQRAWIAAAIAQEAEVLLLDEPTSFLDIGYQVEIFDLIYQLSREKHVTILMSIHDLNQAMSVCDRISLLDKGKRAFEGDPKTLAETGLIENIFAVNGTFVSIAADAPPHFDVELAKRRH